MAEAAGAHPQHAPRGLTQAWTPRLPAPPLESRRAGGHVQLDVGGDPAVTRSGANVVADLGGGTQVILQNAQLNSPANG